jgi:hypothetical protein
MVAAIIREFIVSLAVGAVRQPQEQGSRPTRHTRPRAPGSSGSWDVGGVARGQALRRATTRPHGAVPSRAR